MKLFRIRSSHIFFQLVFITFFNSYFAQEKYRIDSTRKNNIILNSTTLGATSLTYFGLYQLWYKEYPHAYKLFLLKIESLEFWPNPVKVKPKIIVEIITYPLIFFNY